MTPGSPRLWQVDDLLGRTERARIELAGRSSFDVDAPVAAIISLLAFGLVHLPLWGVGVSLTTIASGGILTALYLWRRDVLFLMLAHVATDLFGLMIAPARRNSTR